MYAPFRLAMTQRLPIQPAGVQGLLWLSGDSVPPYHSVWSVGVKQQLRVFVFKPTDVPPPRRRSGNVERMSAESNHTADAVGRVQAITHIHRTEALPLFTGSVSSSVCLGVHKKSITICSGFAFELQSSTPRIVVLDGEVCLHDSTELFQTPCPLRNCQVFCRVALASRSKVAAAAVSCSFC